MDSKVRIMKFFSDFNIPKDYSIGITSLLSNITQKTSSHRGGWTSLLMCQLHNEGYENVTVINNSDHLYHFDAIVFDLGAEFKGILNLFGGLDEKCFNRIDEILNFEGHLMSWQHTLPDLSEIVKMRKDNSSTFIKFKNLADNEANLALLSEICKNTKVFDHVSRKTHLLIGDSHTPSVWSPEMSISRSDGRTLFGALKNRTISSVIKDYTNYVGDLEEITVYLGNIDIRHHLMRQENPYESCINLVCVLSEVLPSNVKVNLVHVLPIENESRKIPGTGFFKGTAFKGSWAERSALVEIFNNTLNKVAEEQKWSVYKHPSTFYNDKNELDFKVMEAPQSIHISPQHYRWNLQENKRRY